MRTNTQTNNLIKWLIIAGDFVMLNAILLIVYKTRLVNNRWGVEDIRLFFLVCNFALCIGEYFFHTIIHQRVVGADMILKRSNMLILAQTLTSYLILRAFQFDLRVGLPLIFIGSAMLVTIILSRLAERSLLKLLRKYGYNTRSVTLIGSSEAIVDIYNKLLKNPTFGYRLNGYYGELENLPRKGGLDDFEKLLDTPEELNMGDELYLCVAREQRDLIERTARLCDNHFVKFYYLPLPEELLSLQSVMLEDVEVFTTYTSPLDDTLNRAVKRLSDIILSSLFLIVTSVLLPVIVLFIKCQSKGPIFFKQKRTGLDGREFYCYKFRSMHVNSDADRVQATKDDPRKFPFGNFMRKTNIDELPQFWNVLRGDMSIVGPRPHMLAHTEQYSKLIGKYMVRHFVKPGVTGWAQVTGFRGETHELWQMEGRVERDIWYIQHWSLWLDVRIIWMTIKTIFVHDEKAF